MADQTDAPRVTLDLSAPELQLILTSLKFLLEAEDDSSEIEALKALIDRLGPPDRVSRHNELARPLTSGS